MHVCELCVQIHTYAFCTKQYTRKSHILYTRTRIRVPIRVPHASERRRRSNTSRGSRPSDTLILLASLRPALRCSVSVLSTLSLAILIHNRLFSTLLYARAALLRIRRSAPECTFARLQLRNSSLIPLTRRTHEYHLSSPSPTVRFLDSFVA